MINIKAIQIANGFIYQHTYQNLVFLNEVCAKLLQSCPTLRDSVDCSPPGSSVHRILQVRTLEWVAMPSSRESPGIAPMSVTSPALAGGFFTTRATWEAQLSIATCFLKLPPQNSLKNCH